MDSETTRHRLALFLRPHEEKIVEGGTEMKLTTLETFLLGVTFGIGITILALYTQKPGRLVESIAESGRARRAKEEEKQFQIERLKAVGFSDEEIDVFLK